MLTKLAVTLDQSPVVITGWPLLFIHTTPGLRQMGLMSSRALHLFWTLIYLERRHCFWENVSCRLSKNKTHLNSKKKKKIKDQLKWCPTSELPLKHPPHKTCCEDAHEFSDRYSKGNITLQWSAVSQEAGGHYQTLQSAGSWFKAGLPNGEALTRIRRGPWLNSPEVVETRWGFWGKEVKGF